MEGRFAAPLRRRPLRAAPVPWVAVTLENPGHTIHFSPTTGATHYRVYFSGSELGLAGRRPLAAFEETDAGLVLADIQLADGSSGIDAVQDILERAPVPAIFITAFPERLLTGHRVEPTFLISKPFRENTVRAAISQSLLFTPELAA